MKGTVNFKGKLKRTVRGPLYLAILLVALNIGIFFVDVTAGLVVTLFDVIYIICMLLLYSHSRATLYDELLNLGGYYGNGQAIMLEHLELPFALLETDGRIIWLNDAFRQLSGKDETYHKMIAGIFPSLTKEMMLKIQDKEAFTVERDEHSYRAFFHKEEISNYTGVNMELQSIEGHEHVLSLMLLDETKRYELIHKYEQEKMAVALLYVDNYDEILEGIDAMKGSLLTALIDRRISQYFSGMDVLIKKYERDKYFVVFRQMCLDTFKENKFHLLEETKDVKVGNDMDVTLSIGVGAKGKDYITNYNYAKAAIDIALGRGGDQAVLKEGEEISYYGAKVRQVEKASRVKARVKAQALQELMQGCDDVIIMGHHIGDVDSFGSAIGIYRAASLMGKPAHVVLDEITSSIRPMVDLFSEEKGYSGNMFLNPQQAVEKLSQNTLVMVVDCNRPSYTECPQLLQMAKTIVVFDHHRIGTETIDNATLSYIEPYSSSACELVTEVLQYFSEDIKLSEDEADCLYAGIIIDTNNFMTKTGVRTFEAAAYLRRAGANVQRVRKMMQNDMEAYRARAAAVRDAEVYHNVFAISICPADKVESPTVACAQAANELLNIVGIKASFVLTNYQNQIYISSRSIDEIDVQSIMEKLGGGGHSNVAGAQLKGYTIDEAKYFIKETLDHMIEEGDIKL